GGVRRPAAPRKYGHASDRWLSMPVRQEHDGRSSNKRRRKGKFPLSLQALRHFLPRRSPSRWTKGLLLVWLAAGSVAASPLPRRASPGSAPPPAPQSWTVSAQYTQFFDDQWVAIATRVLAPDHTFLFRY